MTLDEYERFGQKIYADLADFVAKALSDALGPQKRSDIRLQHVKTRPKALTSLREKLEKNGIAPDEQRIEVGFPRIPGPDRKSGMTSKALRLYIKRQGRRQLR